MRKIIFGCLLLIVLVLPTTIFAQPASPLPSAPAAASPVADQSLPVPPRQDFVKAEVVDIPSQGINPQGLIFQNLKLKILDGADSGKLIDLVNGGTTEITPAQKVNLGDTLVLVKFSDQSTSQVTYYVADKYRLNTLWVVLAVFLTVTLLFAGKRGVGSILGLLTSLAIISYYIIPQIIAGHDPLTVTVIGSIFILLISTYIAHGVSKQTTVALISTFIALMMTVGLASLVVAFSQLAGLGDENAYSLTYGLGTQKINIQGLLLSGIIIGTLGALNDITTTQAATIFELFKHDHSLDYKTLFQRGSRIGQEHIISLVNTLVLAYAGSSIPIFIFFIVNPQQQPLWMMLNSEVLFDEIAKAMAGTVGLILAVPIVTALAASYVTKNLSLARFTTGSKH